ncbi:hypothetical protein TrST_g9822 [Triparma strigata]|uniref:Uncharacterized protein n=1 Tax=Triparma strigata TaxID=1606541 RepID=A0A9W7BX44_9STRA|nr:hypothetical protein TrST_g9822 [Triparma strigata]
MPLHPWSTNEDDASLDDSVSPSPTRGELTMGSGGIRGSILTITKQPPQGQQEQFNADPNVKSALTSIFVSAILPNEDSIRDEGRWITLSDHITNIAQTLPFTWFTTRGSHNFKSPQTPDLSRPKTVPPNYNQYAQNSCVSRSSFNRYWYDLASKFLATSSVKDYEEFTTLIQQEYVKSPPTFPLPAEPATELPINLLPKDEIVLTNTNLPGSSTSSTSPPKTPTLTTINDVKISSRPPSRSLSPPSSPDLILRELSSTLDGRTPIRAPSPPMSNIEDENAAEIDAATLSGVSQIQLNVKSMLRPVHRTDPTIEYTKGLNIKGGVGSTKNMKHMEGKVWPPPSVKLLIDKDGSKYNDRADKFACISYDTINRIGNPESSIVGVIRSLVSEEIKMEIHKPLTADKALIVDVGDGTQSLEDYKFTSKGLSIGGSSGKTDDDKIEKTIKAGASRNLRLQAEYEASRTGFKGVKTLKTFLEMADEVDKTKLEIGGEPLVGKVQTMARINKKRVDDRMRLMRFRSGVGGRKNVQEYLKDKHNKSLKIMKGATDEAYTAYLSQTASLEDEEYHFAEDKDADARVDEEEGGEAIVAEGPPAPASPDNNNNNNANNNVLDEGSVAGSVTSQVSQPVRPDVYISRTPKGGKTRIVDTAKGGGGSPGGGSYSNNPYMSPTHTMEERRGLDELRTLTGGGISPSKRENAQEDLSLGPSLGIRREKRIMCDHEMCRAKFGKVVEAVFWSQVSGHCFCTYCWEMINSHQPHGVAVNYGEKKEKKNEAADEIERAKQARRDSILNAQLRDYQRDNSVHKDEEILERFADLHNPAKQTVEYLRAKANTKSADVYREVEGVPEGASLVNLSTKDRAYLSSLVPQMTDTRVKLGRSYVHDGSLRTPTLHVSARVTVSYMNEETKRGMVGARKSLSKPSLTAHEASRRRKLAQRSMEKSRRQTVKEEKTGGRKTSTNRFTIKSSAGRGKDPLVLSATSLSATGLKAGSSGYAAPDFMKPLYGISNDIAFNDEDCIVDESLLKSRSTKKKGKVVKVVHGVPVYFRDEIAALDASERRKLKRTNSNL